MLSRRAFLRAPAVPGFLARTARAAQPQRDGRVLVVIQPLLSVSDETGLLNLTGGLADFHYVELISTGAAHARRLLNPFTRKRTLKKVGPSSAQGSTVPR
jgi:hypothetical protein